MYVAEFDGELISCHKTREKALEALMEYQGFSKKEIREAMKNGEDITISDPYSNIRETIR